MQGNVTPPTYKLPSGDEFFCGKQKLGELTEQQKKINCVREMKYVISKKLHWQTDWFQNSSLLQLTQNQDIKYSLRRRIRQDTLYRTHGDEVILNTEIEQ